MEFHLPDKAYLLFLLPRIARQAGLFTGRDIPGKWVLSDTRASSEPASFLSHNETCEGLTGTWELGPGLNDTRRPTQGF